MAETTETLQTRAGRWADYMFGRNAMIGVASLMLLVISGYATWHGMRDFIVGVSASTAKSGNEGFSISNDILVVGIVVALTLLMWLALRETFGAKRRLTTRQPSLAGSTVRAQPAPAVTGLRSGPAAPR